MLFIYEQKHSFLMLITKETDSVASFAKRYRGDCCPFVPFYSRVTAPQSSKLTVPYPNTSLRFLSSAPAALFTWSQLLLLSKFSSHKKLGLPVTLTLSVFPSVLFPLPLFYPPGRFR